MKRKFEPVLYFECREFLVAGFVNQAIKETQIYSEFPWHMDVPTFSMIGKSLKMKQNKNDIFCFACSDNSWMN